MSLNIAATQAGAGPFSMGFAPWDYTETERRYDAEKKPFVVVIEDNVGDVLLVEEALREHQVDCDLAGGRWRRSDEILPGCRWRSDIPVACSCLA